MAEIQDLEPVDASNTGRWPEGMKGSQINDSGREMEGYLARWYQDTNGSRAASGSSNAFTLGSSRTISALFDNLTMVFTPNHTITGAATLNLNGLGAKDIVRHNGAALTSGDITSGHPVMVIYKLALDDWVMMSMTSMGTASESATGLIELATAAEMETATDLLRAVTPGRMHRHPGMPKAGGNMNGTGTPAFRSGDYGMGAVTDNGTGSYTLALDTAFANTNFWCAGWCRDDAVRAGILSGDSAAAKTTSTFGIDIHDFSTDPLDSPEVGISFWGDYA